MEGSILRRGAPAASEAYVQRPLSITVIGLYMLFGASLMPVNVWMHAPAFLMGAEFRGREAALFFLALGTLDAVIGIGLLRLAPWSRIVAIYFFLFRAANTFLTFSFPESRGRFEAGVALMRASLGEQSPRSPIWFGPVFILFVMGVAVWFLLTRKKAFAAA